MLSDWENLFNNNSSCTSVSDRRERVYEGNWYEKILKGSLVIDQFKHAVEGACLVSLKEVFNYSC